MFDREYVIKALENCSAPDGKCKNCPYVPCESFECSKSKYPDDLVREAIKLLKEQEPRVLTLEEVEDLPYGHVLIETDKSGSLRWLDALLFCKNANFSFDFITLEGRGRLLGTEYNREWRCWSARPTDEQREAVKWDE